MAIPRFGLNRFDGTSVEAFAADVRRAEELGWDAALQPDSQLRRRDTYVLLAAAARVTERIVLGPLLANPVTRHPTVTASSIATIDELAPGRTLLAMGVGDTAVRLAGLKPARIHELEASTRLMRALLDGEASRSARRARRGCPITGRCRSGSPPAVRARSAWPAAWPTACSSAWALTPPTSAPRSPPSEPARPRPGATRRRCAWPPSSTPCSSTSPSARTPWASRWPRATTSIRRRSSTRPASTGRGRTPRSSSASGTSGPISTTPRIWRPAAARWTSCRRRWPARSVSTAGPRTSSSSSSR